MASGLKTLIKELYIDGYSPTEISTRLKCDRTTVYHHKKADKKEAIDWDEIRDQKQYNQMTSSENFEQDKKEFLTTLFNAFKKAKDEILNIEDPGDRISKLNSFANNYRKFLNPSVHDCKGMTDKASRKTIEIIIDMAADQNEPKIIEFLSDHFEEITTKTVNEVKKIK